MIVFTTSQWSHVRTVDYRTVEAVDPIELRDGEGNRYRVPVGATSDLASTPQSIWSVGFPPFGSYGRAARVHDAAYRGDLERLVNGEWQPADLTKEQSDTLLLDCMIADGVDEAQRVAIYEGVRIGGWKAFNDDRR